MDKSSIDKPPQVSVITVCYNSANTIDETIQSVLNQDYPNVQYIIIDGASTDDTLNIVNRYRAKIDTVVSEPDGGIYDAMNKGILKAAGEVVALLNADDLYASSDVISKAMKAFEDPSLDAIFGDLIYFNDKNPNQTVRYWRGSDFAPGAFGKGWAPAHPTFLVRRKMYQQYGLFNTELAMGNDVELMMRFLEKHQIRCQYLPLLMVKMRLGGVSNRQLKNIFIQNQCIWLLAKCIDFYSKSMHLASSQKARAPFFFVAVYLWQNAYSIMATTHEDGRIDDNTTRYSISHRCQWLCW